MLTSIRFYIALAALLALVICYYAIPVTQAQTGCSAQPAGVVAWYPGDGDTNDLARANHGALQGNTTYTAGHAGQAFSFDGNTDAVLVGNPEQLRLQTLTIEGWIKRASTTRATVDSADAGLIFSYGMGGYGFYLMNNGRLVFGKVGVYGVQSEAGGTRPELKITDTNFHHVVVVKTADKVIFYLDGVASYPFSVGGSFEFTTNAAIGTRGDIFVNSFFGSVDELTIYNRPLSAEEINGLHAAGVAGKCKETSVQFERATYSAAEGGTPVSINITRTGDTSGTTTVAYATSDGTALAGTDYTGTSGTLTFAPGEQSKTFQVTVNSDESVEPSENLQVILSNPAGSIVGTPASATVTLFNTPQGTGRFVIENANIFTSALRALNTDGSNPFYITALKSGTYARHPSVARDTGTIAFEACGEFSPPVDCAKGSRIFVMNRDGSGLRQLTFSTGLQDPYSQADYRPVVSPDGTRVAFISGRGRSHGTNAEVFIVHTDGTNLRQVTTKQSDPNLNPPYASDAYSVTWSPDGHKLLVYGVRRYSYEHFGASGTGYVSMIFTVNPDGTGEEPLVVSEGDLRSEDLILPVHGTAIDWSPDGRHIIFPVNVGSASFPSTGYIVMDALRPLSYRLLGTSELGGAQGSINAGSVRFSPDGQQLVYGMYGPPDASSGGFETQNIHTINIDGTNQRKAVANPGAAMNAKWWWSGASIPQAARFELVPDPLVIRVGQSRQVTPTLYDAQGGVIFHAANYSPDSGDCPSCGVVCNQQHGCTGSITASVDAVGMVSTTDTRSATTNLCAGNAGLVSCALVGVNMPTLSLSTPTPNIFKSGTGGPGTFRIAVVGGANSQFLVTFALGGQAVRGTDYNLTDSSGNLINGDAFTIPAGQTSFDLKVVPLPSQNSGDRDVTLALKTDVVNYTFVTDGSAASATITIKDDQPTQSVLSLSTIAPNKGGDNGKVSVTIHGAGVAPGASVKLKRAGQADITGSSLKIHTSGSYLTATFDLNGRERGLWSVVVTNPNGQSATLTDTFTIEQARDARVWIDVIGSFTMRSALTQKFYIAYGNSGNVDSQPSMFRVYIPYGLTIKEVPVLPDGSRAAAYQTVTDTILEFYAPPIPAQSTTYIPIHLTTDRNLAHESTRIWGWALSSPFLKVATDLQVDPSVNVTSQTVEETDTYMKRVHHVTSSSGSYDVVDEVTVTNDTERRPLSAQVNRGNGSVQYVTGYTIPRGATSASPSPTPTPTPPGGSGLALTSVSPTRGAGGLVTVTIYGQNIHPQAKVKLTRAGQPDIVATSISVTTNRLHAQVAFNLTNKALGVWNVVVTNPDGGSATLPDAYTIEATYRRVTQKRILEDGSTVHEYGPDVINVYRGKAVQRALEAAGIAERSAMGDTFQPVDNITAGMRAGMYAYIATGEFYFYRFELFSFDYWEVSEWALFQTITAAGLRPFGNFDLTPREEPEPGKPPTDPLPLIIKPLQIIPGPTSMVYMPFYERPIVFAEDPNDKVGPLGGGSQHYITGTQAMPYSIFFENKPEATAPAQTVIITDQLDATKFDLSTFQLGPVSFGTNTIVTPPPGLSQWTTDVDLRPANNLVVRINAALNVNTGLVTWTFTSLNPGTMQPTQDPLAGFLPPNKTSPEGEGSVTFTILPKANLQTGEEVRNKARIVFDQNPHIDTPEWLNTIDKTAPSSQVQALASSQCTSLQVRWSGSDTGSSVASYSIYVSDNGGPFTVWQSNTTETSGYFIGEAGHTYAFYSVALDAAGNIEDDASAPDTSTTINTTITLSATSQVFASDGGTGSVNVASSGGCMWTTKSNADWISITSGVEGAGNGSVNFTVTANTDATERAGTLFIAGQAFTVQQAGAAPSPTPTPTPTPTPSPTPVANTIQVGQASYSFNEDTTNTSQGFGVLTVDVIRTDDSAAATVQFLTSDQSGGNECNQVTGQASQRCDYATMAGTLRFAAGETSKQIQISIVNDGYVEGPEAFTIKLQHPVGAALGSLSQATITIVDDDNVPTTGGNNPYLNNLFFVRQNYLDFLGREPDVQGFTDWTNVLNNCGPEKGFLGAPPGCDRAHVSHGFYGSPEFTDRGFLIYRMYEVGMNRLPRYAEFVPDMATLSGFGISDAVKEQNLQDYLQQFTAKTEFTNRFAGMLQTSQAADLVLRLEQTAGVTLPATATTNPGQPKQYSRTELINLRANGTLSVGQTLKAFVEQQPVYDKYFPRGAVTMQYFAYLKRDPDLGDPALAGWTEWVFVFTNGGAARGRPDILPRDIHHLIFGFIYSEEYRKRFGAP